MAKSKRAPRRPTPAPPAATRPATAAQPLPAPAPHNVWFVLVAIVALVAVVMAVMSIGSDGDEITAWISLKKIISPFADDCEAAGGVVVLAKVKHSDDRELTCTYPDGTWQIFTFSRK